MSVDFRACLDALSEVVIHRPAPLRQFDQIYMKLPDMLLQAEHISRWFNGKDILFVGDGDAIALVQFTHLFRLTSRSGKSLLANGPRSIKVLDFDERMVNSVNQFASRHDLVSVISAELYNVADPLPEKLWQSFDGFYTNPPWGASNNGASVQAFIKRGIEASRGEAVACIVIGDHADYPWTHQILLDVQKKLLDEQFRVAEMLHEFHHYHLDDSPELTSCSLVVKRRGDMATPYASAPLTTEQRQNFYGSGSPLRCKYIRDLTNGRKLASSDVVLEPYEE